ncbi:MAG TPA: MutH/Sau3AI family endonuclease, partial [Polyangia bacterium]
MEAETLDALLAHARALVGVELSELADALGLPVPVGNVRTKGWSGQVIEQELGATVGGARGPDFAALGVELKTVPVDENLEPLESTAVCQIDP